jgi:hydroxyisourate hydrolase
MGRFVIALLALIMSASLAHAQSSPKSPGDVSTIVMNGVNGHAAVGMVIELYETSGEKSRKVAQVPTGEDGRAELIASGPLPLGSYELRFQLADYFRKPGVGVGDPPSLDFVPIRFSITDPTGHYHVPLICTPWGYTTYRGS